MDDKKNVLKIETAVITEAQKAKMCFEVITGKISQSEASRMYNVNPGSIFRWVKKFKKFGLPANLAGMNEQQNTPLSSAQSANQDNAATPKNNEELLEALRIAELRIVALETLIDTAEAELSIDIRKKPGAKQ